MSKKRFKIYQDSIQKFESNRIWGVKSETNSLEPYMTFKEAEKCCDLLNEQQDFIDELEKNYDDLVNWVSEIAKRNVVLDEQIGELQKDNEQLKKKNEELRFVLRAEQALTKIKNVK